MIRTASSFDYNDVRKLLAAYAESQEYIVVNLSIWQIKIKDKMAWKARIVVKKLPKR